MESEIRSSPLPDKEKKYRFYIFWFFVYYLLLTNISNISHIKCNDCTKQSRTPFHTVGHRCEYCGSYATTLLSRTPVEPEMLQALTKTYKEKGLVKDGDEEDDEDDIEEQEGGEPEDTNQRLPDEKYGLRLFLHIFIYFYTLFNTIFRMEAALAPFFPLGYRRKKKRESDA
jgi:hypothetical protein